MSNINIVVQSRADFDNTEKFLGMLNEKFVKQFNSVTANQFSSTTFRFYRNDFPSDALKLPIMNYHHSINKMQVSDESIRVEIMVKIADKDHFIEIAVDKSPSYKTPIPKFEFVDITQK